MTYLSKTYKVVPLKIILILIVAVFLAIVSSIPCKVMAESTYTTLTGETLSAKTIETAISAALSGGMSPSEIAAIAQSYLGAGAATVIKDVYKDNTNAAAINTAVDTAFNQTTTVTVNGVNFNMSSNGGNIYPQPTPGTPGAPITSVGTWNPADGSFKANNGATGNIANLVEATVTRVNYATNSTGGTEQRTAATTVNGDAWNLIWEQTNIGFDFNSCLAGGGTGSGCLGQVETRLKDIGVTYKVYDGNVYFGGSSLNTMLSTAPAVYSMCPAGTVPNPALPGGPGAINPTAPGAPNLPVGSTQGYPGAPNNPAGRGPNGTIINPPTGGTSSSVCNNADAINRGSNGVCDYNWPVTITNFTARPATAIRNIPETTFTWSATDHFSTHLSCRIEGQGLDPSITGDKNGSVTRALSTIGLIPFKLTCSNNVHGVINSASNIINVRVILPDQHEL